ncbi:hypothetical protein AA313_de0205922 [Arthrobotrys entomopaga]|nr:hypothetical protein AA313_de0205922 [Arthrobotrys entomopaga]
MAATRVMLLDRLAVDMGTERQRHSASQTQTQPEIATSTANGNSGQSEHKYESSLRRLFKILSEWKTQLQANTTSSIPQAPHISLSEKLRTLVKKSKSMESVISASNEKQKMGIAPSKESVASSSSSGSKTPWLPLELQIQILKNLTWKEQVKMAAVCPTWRAVILEWIVPQDFRSLSGNTVLGPYIINPLLEEIHCEVGSSVMAAESLYTRNGESVLNQPLCFPPATHLLIRVSDLRDDGLEPAVDDGIHVFSTRCCDRYIQICDLLSAMDKFYRQVNEDRVIGDYKSWRSWKFLLETNRWWRRGYVGLCGKWEWTEGGRTLCFLAKKVNGAWEKDFKN